MRLLARLLTGVAGSWALLATPAAAQVAVGFEKQISLEDVSGGRIVVVPKWEHGYFISFDIPDGGTSPAVYVQDADGKHLMTATVSIPDSAETGLSDAAVSPQGDVAVSGGASIADGRATAFIIFISKAGKTFQMVRTSPFTARRLCFNPDGTLWALGWELDDGGMEKTEIVLWLVLFR